MHSVLIIPTFTHYMCLASVQARWCLTFAEISTSAMSARTTMSVYPPASSTGSQFSLQSALYWLISCSVSSPTVLEYLPSTAIVRMGEKSSKIGLPFSTPIKPSRDALCRAWLILGNVFVPTMCSITSGGSRVTTSMPKFFAAWWYCSRGRSASNKIILLFCFEDISMLSLWMFRQVVVLPSCRKSNVPHVRRPLILPRTRTRFYIPELCAVGSVAVRSQCIRGSSVHKLSKFPKQTRPLSFCTIQNNLLRM